MNTCDIILSTGEKLTRFADRYECYTAEGVLKITLFRKVEGSERCVGIFTNPAAFFPDGQ